MVSRQIIRPGQVDDVPPHEHDATHITGVFNFLRALKGKISGSFRVTGDLTVADDAAVSIGGDVPVGAGSGQVFIHNTLHHLTLFEKGDGDYPNTVLVLDINDKVGRLFWGDGRSGPIAFSEYLRLFGPAHATQANDIELVNSAGVSVLRWDDSLGAWFQVGDIVMDNNLIAPSFRTRLGPDTSDFWLVTQDDSGDALTVQQWDQSAGAVIDRIKIPGTGTGVTDSGAIILYDGTGSEVARIR